MRVDEPPARTCTTAEAAEMLGYADRSRVLQRLRSPRDQLRGYRADDRSPWLVDRDVVERELLAAAVRDGAPLTPTSLPAPPAAATPPTSLPAPTGFETAGAENPLALHLALAESERDAARAEVAAAQTAALAAEVDRLRDEVAAAVARAEQAEARLVELGRVFAETVAALTRPTGPG